MYVCIYKYTHRYIHTQTHAPSQLPQSHTGVSAMKVQRQMKALQDSLTQIYQDDKTCAFDVDRIK